MYYVVYAESDWESATVMENLDQASTAVEELLSNYQIGEIVVCPFDPLADRLPIAINIAKPGG